MPPNVSLKGIENPVRRSRSRLPPVILSTVSIMILTPTFLGALHHGAIERAVFVEIELVDLRRVVGFAYLLQTDRAQGRHPEHSAEFCRCGRYRAFAVVVE